MSKQAEPDCPTRATFLGYEVMLHNVTFTADSPERTGVQGALMRRRMPATRMRRGARGRAAAVKAAIGWCGYPVARVSAIMDLRPDAAAP